MQILNYSFGIIANTIFLEKRKKRIKYLFHKFIGMSASALMTGTYTTESKVEAGQYQDYRMTRLTFGVTSPFLATQQLAS